MLSRRLALAATLASLFAALGPACEKKDAGTPKTTPAAAKPTSPTAPPAQSLKIAVVPKGTTHDFWKSIHAGAIKAANELGNVQIVFQGPEREDDRVSQISLVQTLLSGGYSAIVLAPLDNKALVPPIKQATANNIPVVIIDSGVEAEAGKDFVSFVATDNYKGGKIAGEHMAKLLDGKGKVLLLRYQEGSASTDLREQGFIDGIKTAPGITLIDPKRYAGATRATAQEASENLLTANTDIQGVFCPNESSTFGMLLALRARSLAGKARFMGFDASDAVVDAMSKGEIDGLILQNPVNIGYQGVKAAVDHIRGKKVETRIDTGVQLVTKADMDKPEIKDLLHPDLSKYLDQK